MRYLKLCPEETSDILINLFLNFVGVEFFARHSFNCLCTKVKLIGKELHSEILLRAVLLKYIVTFLVCDSYSDGEVLSVHYIWLDISERACIIACCLAGKAWVYYDIIEVEREGA